MEKLLKECEEGNINPIETIEDLEQLAVDCYPENRPAKQLKRQLKFLQILKHETTQAMKDMK